MIGHSFGGVIFGGRIANEESPITGLRQKKLAYELAQDAVIIRGCLSVPRFCQSAHACVCGKKVWINPATFIVQPDTEEPLIAPARCCRLDDLLRGILLQKFARCSQRQHAFGGTENDLLEKE